MDSIFSFLLVYLLRNNFSYEQSNYSGGISLSMQKKLIKWIDEHIESRISIDDLSKISGFSKNHFIRTFREEFGQTPHQYIIHRRLARSKELITYSYLPIQEIAKCCGFSTNSHFTECFKKLYGMTPQFFRKKIYSIK